MLVEGSEGGRDRQHHRDAPVADVAQSHRGVEASVQGHGRASLDAGSVSIVRPPT